MPKSKLTAERLRQIVHYCPESGVFTWLSRDGASPQWNGLFAGQEAGHIRKQGGGYRAIGIEGAVYMAAVLAWLYVTGEWPLKRVYLKDGDKTNLRFANLLQGHKCRAHFEPPFSVDVLRDLLLYHEASGQFTWRKRPRGGPSRVGCVERGHLKIMLFRQSFAAERLAWFYVTGKWPTVQIVHRNGDGLDNSFTNLLGPREDHLASVSYDPATGAFTRAGKRVDRVASSTSVVVTLDIDYDAASLAWFLQTGEWLETVHHRNQDPWDNSFSNLSSIKMASMPLSVPGVEWKSKRHCWQARLVDSEGRTYTQLFQNKFDAVEARLTSEAQPAPSSLPERRESKAPSAAINQAKRPVVRKRREKHGSVAERPLPDNTSSGCPGVYFNKANRKWRVAVSGQNIGSFDDLEDAIAARKAAEVRDDGSRVIRGCRSL